MKASTQKIRLIHKIGLHEGLRETPGGHSMRKSLRRRLALSEVFGEALVLRIFIEAEIGIVIPYLKVEAEQRGEADEILLGVGKELHEADGEVE